MTTGNSEQKLCTKCVGVEPFVSWIREHGARGTCDLDPSHGNRRTVVEVPLFAEAVDVWFREHYQLGGEEMYVTEDSDNPSYRQRGEPYTYIMMDELECDTRYDFIKQMEEQISKPILPYEKQREYIATQIVAEYLKEYFGCDAVIFRSSMIRDRSVESRNIVILPRNEPFAGSTTAVLSFARHDVKEVRNVIYERFKSPF